MNFFKRALAWLIGTPFWAWVINLRPPLGNPRNVVILITLFLTGFFFARACEAHDDPPNVTIVEFGPVFLSADFADTFALGVMERFKGKWELGVILVGEANCDCNEGKIRVSNNAALRASRIITIKDKWEIGLGYTYWSNESAILGQRQTFELSFGRKFGFGDRDDGTTCKNQAMKYHHWSQASQSSPNRSYDVPMWSWRLGECRE